MLPEDKGLVSYVIDYNLDYNLDYNQFSFICILDKVYPRFVWE